MIYQKPTLKQTGEALDIICTGDIILDAPDPDHWLSGITPAFQRADLVIGHLEVPHTARGSEQGDDVPAPGAAPEHLDALSRAGFDIMTLAGNHMADCGPEGISDTISRLDSLGIGHCGAGENLTAARQPVLTEMAGRTVALLSYNCVGPEFCWAGPERAGCAYLPVATADGSPVAPARKLTRPDDECRAILQEDIGNLRKTADLVIVALHKGVVHTPAVIEPYERALAHLACDAGADVVISHHAHIIRGIEYYRGKPIYHGLGNGCVVTNALSPAQDHPARAEWAERRKAMFGFEPDPAFTLAPFHPQAVNAFIAKLHWRSNGSLVAGIVPVRVEAPGRPRLADPQESADICTYLQQITKDAGLAPLKMETTEYMVRI